MKRVVIALAAVAVLGAADRAAAQEAPKPATSAVEKAIEDSGIVPALEKVAATATPELERALGALATSLGALATRIATDQELRTSAARAGRGVAEVAEVAVVEQSATITEALRAIADRLEAILAERPRQQ